MYGVRAKLNSTRQWHFSIRPESTPTRTLLPDGIFQVHVLCLLFSILFCNWARVYRELNKGTGGEIPFAADRLGIEINVYSKRTPPKMEATTV